MYVLMDVVMVYITVLICVYKLIYSWYTGTGIYFCSVCIQYVFIIMYVSAL